MATSAEVPLRWQALMDHVAGNMDAHATWVGTATAAAKQEHDSMRRVAAAWAGWMREKIRMQRALATMLEQHAAASERALSAER